MTPAVLLIVGAYVVGSIPFGLLIGRWRGVDVRAVGSGNIGATNVARALGKGWAVFVLLCDASKGFVPVFVARHHPEWFSPWVVAAAGLAAIVGHMFTLFLRGRGGKGVATSLGVAFGLSPPIALVCFGLYVAAYAATRLSSIGSLIGMWSFPVVALARGGLTGAPIARAYLTLSIVTALLVTARHAGNLRRLVRGEEKRA